jgi:integrase
MSKKRGQREGSIYQRKKDGRWVGSIDLGWQGGRRARKYIYGPTQDSVVDRMADARKEAKDGTLVLDERQTVGDFLNRWLQDCARPKVRPTTLRRYADLIRLHIAPEIGGVPLAKLTAQRVQSFLNQKCGATAASTAHSGRPAPSGLSPRSVQHLHAVLRVALGQALRWGLVARNVATLVSPPRAPHKDVQPFSPEEARQFLETVSGDRLEALYTVALACGLRQGEALGLWWEDVNGDAGTLTVRRQLQRIAILAPAAEPATATDSGALPSTTAKKPAKKPKTALRLVEPKTKRSRRTIALPNIVVKALRAHRVRQLQERLLAGSRWQDTGFVFTTTIGTPLDARNVQDGFKAVLRKAGLRSQRFHDLRHGAASLLLAQGVAARGVMEILGHSQIGITLNLYSHVMPELLRDAAQKMDAILAAR